MSTTLLRFGRIASLLFLTTVMAVAAPTPAAHYQQCLAASSANPAAALKDAEDWIKTGGGIPATRAST